MFSFSRHFIGRPIQNAQRERLWSRMYRFVAFFSFVGLFIWFFFFIHFYAICTSTSMCIELALFYQFCSFLCSLFFLLPFFFIQLSILFYIYFSSICTVANAHNYNCKRVPRQYWPKRIAFGECDNENMTDT